MRQLADYYTGKSFAKLLISALNIEEPTTAVDLGAGQGALLQALSERWPAARLHAAEIDHTGWPRLRGRFPQLQLFQGSGLSDELLGRLGLEKQSVDVAVCNPPYLSHVQTPRTDQLLREAGLGACCKLKHLSSGLLFLAQNLRLLRAGGEVGVILPDTLISSKDYTAFRDALLANHRVFGIIQLPRLAFSGAEAQTHALLIQSYGSTSQEIPIWSSDFEGSLAAPVSVPSKLLVHRMDHAYHAWRANDSARPGSTLMEMGAEIKRGSRTHAECRKQGLATFHTSNFVPGGLLSLEDSTMPSGIIAAQPGDILVARVGTRCIGRVGLVTTGSAALTDCVYRVRVPGRLQDIVWRSLLSRSGQAWLQAHAYGVCARSISKRDLLQFPVNEER